jgi:hypothetical protein
MKCQNMSFFGRWAPSRREPTGSGRGRRGRVHPGQRPVPSLVALVAAGERRLAADLLFASSHQGLHRRGGRDWSRHSQVVTPISRNTDRSFKTTNFHEKS